MKNAAKNLFATVSGKNVLFPVVVACIAAAMAFFARSIVFYGFDTSAAAYQIRIEHSELEFPREIPLRLSYQNEQIVLEQSAALPDGCATIYASSPYGTAILDADSMKNPSPHFLGSFAAVVPMQNYDIGNDGKTENVYFFLKTDLRSIQTNASPTPMFRDPLIMLEVGLYESQELYVYFNARILSERPVTIHFADGTQKEYQTDSSGHIKGIPIKEIRKGIAVQYAPNNKNVYIMKYVPEGTKIISSAIIPVINLAVLTAAGIFLCLFIRGRMRRTGFTMKGRSGFARKPPSLFMTVRWIVMMVSFLALMYGGSFIGYWFENITVPVFSCGLYNKEQLVGSSCYYLSHLNLLVQLPWQNIVLFVLSFFIPIVLMGRVLCGFVCPMGLVQDALNAARQRAHVDGIALSERLYGRLATIKWVFVMLFLCMCFAGLDFCNICPVLTLSPGFSGFKASVYAGGFVMLFALIGSFFKRRFFCAVCPLGLIMGLFHTISLFRLKKDCTACTECGACYEACPMGIRGIYTEREKSDVTSFNCVLCGECIRQCPEDNALSMTFCGKKVYTASREKFMSQYKGKR